jgi:glycosyltransferase involved in cell wall biosynthesis
MEKISLIAPCYNEEKVIDLFYQEIQRTASSMAAYAFEFIFVDDGSTDRTISILKKFAEDDSRVKFLSFSRNYGKEAAIYAGLCFCTGDYAAILDADLQDPPSLLVGMMASIQDEEYDCVATRRNNRKGEPAIRSFFAKKFYQLINVLSKTEIVDGARDFRLMKRCVVDAILELKEYNRFTKGIFGWIGFKTKWISYENIVKLVL